MPVTETDLMLEPDHDYTLVTHHKNGKVYSMVGLAHYVGDTNVISYATPMMVYQNPDTDELWIRPVEEFFAYNLPAAPGEKRQPKFEEAASQINRLLDSTRGAGPEN